MTWHDTVFPARAGMSPHPRRWKTRKCCVPRASGDEPQISYTGFYHWLCSPRERG